MKINGEQIILITEDNPLLVDVTCHIKFAKGELLNRSPSRKEGTKG
jgi:hypothetical protein